MNISPSQHTGTFNWITNINDNSWFEASFATNDLGIRNANNMESAIYVQKLLRAAVEISPAFKSTLSQSEVVNNLEFDICWGLGSSSTLLSNVAWWAGIDPFDLHDRISKGSGYDVACARADTPILFELEGNTRKIISVDFNPSFSDILYFIYLGSKKDSQAEVDDFKRREKDMTKEVSEISNITQQMASCSSASEFGRLLVAHEEILSGVLNKPTLKSSIFNDFQGEIKSLGAWGGDFAMALWPFGINELEKYLSNKGLKIFFPYHQLVYGGKS